MKIAEIVNEAGGPQMTRRGFLGNVLATAASKGIDPTGLLKIADKLGPDLTGLVGDMLSWVGDDQKKYVMLTDWLDNLDRQRHHIDQGDTFALPNIGIGIATPKDISVIRNKVTKTYRKNNPDATANDALSVFNNWLRDFYSEFKQNDDRAVGLEILRRAKGAPLEFDPVIEMIKSHNMDNPHEMVKLITELPDIHHMFLKVRSIVNAAAYTRMQATYAARQAANAISAQRQAAAARHPIASQIDKATSMLDKLASAPDKVKFAIERQMTAIQTKVAALESAPLELAKTINDKCEWIKNNLDSAVDNPKVAEEIAKQLASIEGVLAELPNAEPVADDAETDKTTEPQA